MTWATGRPTCDRLAAAFGHGGVAGAYRHRPPYPPEVFDILERIITDRPRRVLDLGAGEGALARPLAARWPGDGRRRGPRSYGRRARRMVGGSMSP